MLSSYVKLATFALLGALNWIPRWFSLDGSSSQETIRNFYAQFRDIMCDPALRIIPEASSPHSSPQDVQYILFYNRLI